MKQSREEINNLKLRLDQISSKQTEPDNKRSAPSTWRWEKAELERQLVEQKKKGEQLNRHLQRQLVKWQSAGGDSNQSNQNRLAVHAQALKEELGELQQKFDNECQLRLKLEHDNKAKEQKMEAEIDILRKDLEELNKQNIELHSNVNDKDLILNEKQKLVEEKEKNLDDLWQRYNQILENMDLIKAELNVQKELSQQQELQRINLKDHLEKINSENQELLEKLKEKDEKLQDKDLSIKDLYKSVTELEEKIRELEKVIENLQSDLKGEKDKTIATDSELQKQKTLDAFRVIKKL